MQMFWQCLIVGRRFKFGGRCSYVGDCSHLADNLTVFLCAANAHWLMAESSAVVRLKPELSVADASRSSSSVRISSSLDRVAFAIW